MGFHFLFIFRLHFFIVIFAFTLFFHRFLEILVIFVVIFKASNFLLIDLLFLFLNFNVPVFEILGNFVNLSLIYSNQLNRLTIFFEDNFHIKLPVVEPYPHKPHPCNCLGFDVEDRFGEKHYSFFEKIQQSLLSFYATFYKSFRILGGKFLRIRGQDSHLSNYFEKISHNLDRFSLIFFI